MIFPQIIKQMLKDNDNMSQYIPALKQNIIEPLDSNIVPVAKKDLIRSMMI
jgi:hypothetical protein